MRLFFSLLAALAVVTSAFPELPLSTSGRWIVNSQGQNVTMAGVNWVGHLDAMIPEGMQYQSLEYIVSKIRSLGMNVIRLTWSVEMIDDIYDNNPNQTIKNSLIHVLGEQNGTDIYQKILKNNPQFNDSSTRLDAFDALAAECHKQGVYVHLDNQMSKAAWCCNFYDGDGWFGATNFNVANWTRGLAYLADHGKKWPSFASMSLRNELRQQPNSPVQNDYGWPSWYTHMTLGASAIHQANPDILIYFSGLNSDHELEQAVAAEDLGNGTRFLISDFDYAKKVVFEYHVYGGGNASCETQDSGLWGLGFNAMDTSPNTKAKNIAPVITSEFGFPQDDESYLTAYPQCLAGFLTSIQGGFMQWSLAGSLYIKWGQQDVDDTWAILNHDWSDWRSYPSVLNYTLPLTHDVLGLPNNVSWSFPGWNQSASSTTSAGTSGSSGLPTATANGTSPSATNTPSVTPTSNAAEGIAWPTGVVGFAAVMAGAMQVVL